MAAKLHGTLVKPGAFRKITGLQYYDKVINITQDPIGRTPRSNPATYIGVYDDIREVFAQVPESKARGYGPGRFSFNVHGGRCEACKGHGQKCVEMHFLPDVWITCDACKATRFNRETLQVKFKGRSISDILAMDVKQALDLFGAFPGIARLLGTLNDVGLEYVKLGQSATTLSGGEAQRVKLAKELSKKSTGRTLYILDEPTTGLHFADIQKLLDVLHRLTDEGNTVIVIEHNLDVIKTADWIVDLGPEGGLGGGEIVAFGTPEEVAQAEHSFTAVTLRSILPPHVL
jgi:excinuclease ABC subunit A